MQFRSGLSAAVSVCVLAAATPALAESAPAKPAASLVDTVSIPYEQFTLNNGLRVIVHEDRKAPIVGVTVYYRVGSKNEPKGKTGFAHLFEHLMFGGSENVPNFDKPLVEAGSTATNGSTSDDRTNYIEVVPTGALDRALFMEADRMGRLLGAVTQGKLDAQRGVVQNEKRQGDNEPFGLVDYVTTETLFPADHPYGHTTIGSMADLDAASLADVHQWFKDNYGPNNAILVLAGDIDARTARAKVERYFGAIARGPHLKTPAAPIPTLPARVDKVMKDRIANPRIMRRWVVPGLNDRASADLDVAASILGGLASSRLDNAFVRGDKTAASISAGFYAQEQLGHFIISADLKPGVDPAVFGGKLDALVADYIAKGPSADEVKRAVTQDLAQRIRGLQEVGGFRGKASTLAEGELYSGKPDFYKTELKWRAGVTPASVSAAMKQWLARPVFALSILPGEREPYAEAKGAAGAKVADAPLPTPKLPLPAVAPTRGMTFPAVQTVTLANGARLHYAQRTAVPMTWLAASFDAGYAAEPASARGLGKLTYAVMQAGTQTRSEVQIAEDSERLGANLWANEGADRTDFGLRSLSANLAPALDLLADVVRNPAFDAAEIDRKRAMQLAQIAMAANNPRMLASQAFYQGLYGNGHPYATAVGSPGDAAALRGVTRDQLVRYHDQWVRPDMMELFVVSNLPLAAIKPLVEQRFGDWRAPAVAKGAKAFAAPLPKPQPVITFIDRPQSPQSVIMGGFVTAKKGGDDRVALDAADTVLGNDFLSRINMDLREEKAWTYGANAALSTREYNRPYVIQTSVQADRTGDSIAALTRQVRDFVTSKGITGEEFTRTVNGTIGELPARYETAEAVLGQMQSDAIAGRPADYVNTLPARYRALTPAAVDAAARGIIDPAQIRWVVVGDGATVRPQLAKLGMTVVEAAPATPSPASK